MSVTDRRERTDTSFDDALAALLRAAREAHDDAHVLQGQLFADERGWLSDAERDEMERRQARAATQTRDLDERITAIARDHADAWRAWLTDGIARFIALGSGQAQPISPAHSRDLDFDRTLAPSLRDAWRKLRDSDTRDASAAWALAVGAQLFERYR